MCAKINFYQPTGAVTPLNVSTPSPVPENTFGSGYRVLRDAMGRPIPRSVDRDCAGRNATSVKGSSPEKQYLPWWPSEYVAAKATSIRSLMDATGVQDHGMYRRLVKELGRSPESRSGMIQTRKARLITKSRARSFGEFRCLHSSREVV